VYGPSSGPSGPAHAAQNKRNGTSAATAQAHTHRIAAYRREAHSSPMQLPIAMPIAPSTWPHAVTMAAAPHTRCQHGRTMSPWLLAVTMAARAVTMAARPLDLVGTHAAAFSCITAACGGARSPSPRPVTLDGAQ